MIGFNKWIKLKEDCGACGAGMSVASVTSPSTTPTTGLDRVMPTWSWQHDSPKKRKHKKKK